MRLLRSLRLDKFEKTGPGLRPRYWNVQLELPQAGPELANLFRVVILIVRSSVFIIYKLPRDIEFVK